MNQRTTVVYLAHAVNGPGAGRRRTPTETKGEGKMPTSSQLARFNKRLLNHLFLRVAGFLSGFGIVGHIGRKSGRAYRVPVNVFRTDDGYIITLTYGSRSDSVKDVLAAGSCEL